jgi:hypothetical protein
LFAAGAVLGWLLNGQFELTGLQWFFLLVGFMLLYKDAVLLGAAVTYIVTDQGIGIRYVPGDYRPFFKFGEIRQAVRIKPPGRIPVSWYVLAPRKHPDEGVLLSSASPSGFSSQFQEKVLLAPMDMDGFLNTLSGHVLVSESSDDFSRPSPHPPVS